MTHISGTVTGRTPEQTAWVSALRHRDLRRDDAWLVTAPTSATGRFSVPIPEGISAVWLVVTDACDPQNLSCRCYFPAVLPVPVGAADVVLRAPDPVLAQTLWAGTEAPGSIARSIGLGVIAGLLALGAWLLRRGPDVRVATGPAGNASWGPDLALGSLFFAAGLWRLGTEPLDLLEYSYFHEALRPSSALAVLSDPISAELAHGPVMPLVLRLVAGVSEAAGWLRTPSLLFGAAFVVLVSRLLARVIGAPWARCGALLAIVSPLCSYYARDATPYALAGLLAALAVALVELPRTHGWWRWSTFALVHLVGFFTHYGFAFFSLAQGLGLLVSGVGDRKRTLGFAALAFGVAAILPVAIAPHLEHMLAVSGLRFGLMSGAYPESPGFLAFGARMLAVIAGVAGDHPWTLLLWLAPAIIGGRVLLRRSPTLFGQAIACVVLTLVWLGFSHSMSTEYGGGRIYWAFRWARPLVLGFILLPAAALGHRIGGPLAGLLGVAGLWLMGSSVVPPVRPAQEDVAAVIRTQARTGDAYAVLPASFYGDPLQYYLADGKPPALLTSMRTADLIIGPHTLRGPVVELDLPFETAVDRLQHERLWVVAYSEQMFGTPKFSPGPTDQALAALRATGWTEALYVGAPFMEVWRFECGIDCAWEGQRVLSFAFAGGVRADRFVDRDAGTEGRPFDLPTRLVLPDGATTLVVRGPKSAVQGALRFTGTDVVTVESPSPGEWRVHLRPAHRPRVTLAGTVNPNELTVEVSR